jgi:hypothetical protein
VQVKLVKKRELLTSLISSRNLSNEWKSSPQAPHDWLNSHRPTPTICNTSAGPDSDSTEETHLDGVVLNEYPADEDGDDGNDGVPEEMADTEVEDMDIDEGAVADEMDVDESATVEKVDIDNRTEDPILSREMAQPPVSNRLCLDSAKLVLRI